MIDIKGLEISTKLRKKYMDQVSNDIRSVENILKESGLEQFFFENFAWKYCCSCSTERLCYKMKDNYSQDIHNILMECKFEIREKAHKELSRLVEFLKDKNEENI